MRLKQLLGTILLGVSAVSMAAASDSQLSGVLVKSHDNAGVVTILASGTFTHAEYRPTDTLMLVDLAGVSLPQQDAKLHSVFAPGVRSYRIQSYRSPNGGDVARIELNLMPGAHAQVSDVTGGIQIELSGAPSAVPSPREIAALADRRSNVSSVVAHISKVSVDRNADGLSIEIAGSGPLTAKTMKLTGPDRLVVDIPNSQLDGHNRAISVNSNDVKTVRAAHYQDDPPATRVVIDLAAMRDFDVAPAGNKLIVKLHDSARLTRPVPQPAVMEAAAKAPAVTTTNATASQPKTAVALVANNDAKSSEPKPEIKTEISSNPPAQNFVVVTPTFTTASDHSANADNTANAKLVEASNSRAEQAASHFAQPTTSIAANNLPPFGSASLAAKPAAINAALQAQQAAPQPIQSAPTVGNCTSGRYNGEPIGMNFKDLDLKDFFRVIHEISGLNVVLDPAVKGSVTIVLDDVPWDQALAIVLNNNGLECQLQGNVLRIATLETLKTEAEARRAQQEAQALAVPKQTITRYLSYGQSKDAVIIIKKFLSPRGDVVADPRSNALIIEDIPAALEKIDPLLRTLDRKTPEVEIEARVVAATRSFSRDIGTQLGFGFADGHTAVGGATQDSPIKVNDAAIPGNGPIRFIQGTTAGTVPLFSNLPATGPTSGVQVSTTTFGFRLDYILTMAESRGLLKILSRPHIVTQNNILALIKQGQRVPVVTNQQLGGPPTVTYIDAFLRLSVTPQITAENTIFLNVDVENTVPDFSRVTGAQLNPALNTQQATTQVLVTDGGTVVIGGVVQSNNNVAVNQVPVLGSIPILGNLFKHTFVNTSTQELIFFITPKIIQT